MPARRDEAVPQRRALPHRKCAIEKRNFIPASTGRIGNRRLSGYGLQLREKQKARRYYQLLEGQFRNLFEKASGMKGITGDNMLNMLERRLDNVIYRMGFGTSRAQSRQLVRHGHIQVNGRRVDIPSFLVKPNDVIEIQESSKKNPAVLHATEATAHSPSPNWLEVDRENLQGPRVGTTQARGPGADSVERATHCRVVFE
jgi:small subunit ribosomal protein S4